LQPAFIQPHDNVYMYRYKILSNLLICNKKPRSFVRNGALSVSPYSLQNGFTGWSLSNCFSYFCILLSRLSFEIYNKKKDVRRFLSGSSPPFTGTENSLSRHHIFQSGFNKLSVSLVSHFVFAVKDLCTDENQSIRNPKGESKFPLTYVST